MAIHGRFNVDASRMGVGAGGRGFPAFPALGGDGMLDPVERFQLWARRIRSVDAELHPTGTQSDDAVADLESQFRSMQAKQQRSCLLFRHVYEQSHDVGPAHGVEARDRFVGEHQGRPLYEHSSDRDPLALPARQPVGPGMEQFLDADAPQSIPGT